MFPPADGLATSRGAALVAAEHRRVRNYLLLAGALALALIAFELSQGLRLARLERANAAADSARDIAAELSLMFQREQVRVERVLPELHETLTALPEQVGSEAWWAAAESRLKQSLPTLIALLPAVRDSNAAAALAVDMQAHAGAEHPRIDTHLVPGNERPLLVHHALVAGLLLELHRDCLRLRDLLAADRNDAHLVHRDGAAWPLASAAETHLLDALPLLAAQIASAPIPHAGAEGWRVVVARSGGGVAALPALIPALVLVVVTAVGGWRLWAWTRRRELLLLAEQQRLVANQRKLEAVLDATTDGIVMLDPAGRIELLNPAAEVMFGQLESDVHGAGIAMLLPGLAAGSDAAARPPAAGVYDIEALRGGSHPFPVRIAERRLNLDDGWRRLLLVQDLTEQQRQAEQLAFLAQRDVITGLLNRAEFERRMGRRLAEAADSDTPHALLYIDIDQFKVINDTMGHAAGDALIGQLAKIIEVKLEAAVIVGRLGGDEFGALFADHTEDEVLDICEDLMQTVRNFLFTWREHSYDVAISIGVTAFLPEHESPASELAKADVACHMAKSEGRDRVHVYRDSDVSLIRRHGEMHLVSTISQALTSGRFRLYSQPIMPLTGADKRTHFEILVRMLDEHGELVAPDEFIPAAERYILMPSVDRWIIQQLFSTQAPRMRTWHREAPGEFMYAVNLSGTSISDEGFLPYLKRQFDVHDVPPACICFEVTETAAMRDLGQARSFIDTLAALGCSFALDDFGSGLSSYGYLRDLPVQYLKIDGSFVRNMESDPVNYALVASINQVAHVLGLKTIAEWAESETVINQLRALNVDYVQGFAIGTPLPVVDVPPELAATLPGPHLEPGPGDA